MTTFADVAPRQGRALMWLLDVSFDKFVTVAYRYATHVGDVNGFHYQRRIVGLGNIKRGFGQDHLPAASTVTVTLDNTDFAADWLVDRGTVASQVLQAQFRLHCGLSTDDPNTHQATIKTQQVGQFVSLDYPRRNASAILLSLSDDSLGQLSDVLIAPSILDWFQDVGTTTANSLFGPIGVAPTGSTLESVTGASLIDTEAPIPIQFGKPRYEAQTMAESWELRNTPAGAPPDEYDFDVTNWPRATGSGAPNQRSLLYPIIVLATRSTANITTDDVRALRGTYRSDLTGDATPYRGYIQPIPETFFSTVYNSTVRIWKSYKSQTITRDGYDWKILWIAFNASAYDSYFAQSSAAIYAAGPNGVQYGSGVRSNAPRAKPWSGLAGGGYDNDLIMQAFAGFDVSGSPGSGVVDGSTGIGNEGNACNILKDMVESYSTMGAGSVDGPRFARASLVTNIDVRGAISGASAPGVGNGTVLSARVSPYGVGALRQAIQDLAGSADLDVFLTMDGKVGMVTQGADFESATAVYPTFSESRINNVEEHTPSTGERWSPYNRVYVMSEGDGGTGRGLGPYDNPAAIAEWGRIIAKTLHSKWWTVFQDGQTFYGGGVWRLRNLESKIRNVISFTTDLGFLVVELGDYFYLPWTRGGQNSAYPATLWRLEGVTITPDGGVTATAVWMDDLRTDNPWLLDNEALVVRATPGFADTLTVTTGSTTATRSSGSFITDGVSPGDQILMRDASEAATAFARNRQIRVVSVTNALNLVVSDSVFGSAGTHVLAATDWQMMRSAVTYPTVVSDAANYPSGGLMFGKIASVAGVFSDASPGNKLQEG